MEIQNYDLLKTLCSIHAPSGNEVALKEYILRYVESNKSKWKVQPEIIAGEGFQDCIILVFGKPRTAVYTHMDSIGFTVRYNNRLIPIGGPEAETGFELIGEDSKGKIETKLIADPKDGFLSCDFHREIDRGTELVFKSNWIETEQTLQSCYMDNRLGVFVSLMLAQNIENGAIVFSCYEEHGGGTVPFLVKYLWDKYSIVNNLVCDITWATEGVIPGKGVAISMRDSRIPRKSYLEKIISATLESNIAYQLEVEGSGGSDGKELQMSPFPVDWIFIGAAEDNVHSPKEKVHKADINSMLRLYEVLLDKL